jgi:two-component sensor histidine kinase
VSGRLQAVRYVGTLQDITARKADEERLRLLAREVDHRANNLMTVVQGAVALSQAADPEALKTVITGRVNALARAHQLLAQARWEGADLRRLVEEELLAFSLGDEGRVSIRGDPVALPPAAAQSLAMALHELATNAAKFGALSAPGGRVVVSWAHDPEGGLEICWREAGGPTVRKPHRKGLGTTLLGRALAGPIRGWTTLDWRPEGLVCQLRLPPAALELAVAPPVAPGPEAEPRSRSAR